MKKLRKIFYPIIIGFFILSIASSCHKKAPYNPYLDLKVKPHQEEGKKTKKAARKAAKAYRQQLRSNRKAVFGKKVAPK